MFSYPFKISELAFIDWMLNYIEIFYFKLRYTFSELMVATGLVKKTGLSEQKLD